jgi:hypothetical protein
MLMVQALFPIIDGLTAVILAGLEALKGYFGMKVAEYNIRIRNMADKETPSMRPIGFSYEDQEDNENE